MCARARKADKQQEDLDLPYLTSQSAAQHQDLPDATAAAAALHRQQLAASQSHASLAPTKSTLESSCVAAAAAAAGAAAKQPAAQLAQQHQSTAKAPLDKRQQICSSPSAPHQSPILVAKSASSSNVLSAVSLASGAQMKSKQVVAVSAPQAADQPQAATKLADNKAAQTDEEANQQEANQQLVARAPQIQTPQPKINQLKQLLRHTNSLNQLPEFGVEVEREKELDTLMGSIDVWGLNIFDVHKLSQEHSLTVVVYKIFKVSFPLAVAG